MSELWAKVAALSDLPKGKSMTVGAHGYAVALFNVDGEICATQDACPHEGVSLGMGGCLNGEIISCGYHHWDFNIKTGVSEDGFEDALWVFPVKVSDGVIYVGLPDGLTPAALD